MPPFDPIALRRKCLSEEVPLRYYLERRYDEKQPIGNFAAADLKEVIRCWLLWLETEIAPVLPRALEWLDKAIEAGEEEWFGPSPRLHRRTLHWAKALGQWMHTKENDEATWKVAKDAQAEHMRTGFVKVLGADKFDYKLQRFVPQEVKGLPFSSRRLMTDGMLDDFMAFSFQASQYEAGIEEYERHLAPKIPSLKKTLQPRGFAYALCLQKLGRARFDENDLLDAGRRMLQANLQDLWIKGGQYTRAATWLKIVYWHHDQTLTPRKVVLKAYDDMPDVARPYFL